MAKYTSSQFTQRKRKDFLIKTGLLLVFVVVVFLCISEIFKFNFANIKEVNISGNKIVKTSDIQNIVLENLKGNYFWKFFPKRNILIYPRENLTAELFEKKPRIKEIDLKLKDFNNLIVKIKERDPFAFWCQENELIDECFVVDSEGLIFDKERGEDLFKYYVDLNDKKIIGKSVFEFEKFKEIDSIIKFVTNLKLEPYKLVQKENKLEIYILDGSKIIFNKDQSAQEVITNLQSVMNMKDFDITKIGYVDFSFGNKVFYK
ncbi:hypothetical protein A2996_01705 [Candidatus Campbellbacteria bacterium RIFCSPLOWO2_01_FULL_34_15]|uniref:POTRA domain-containing protein n=1 Tax=Candidatus Campbellbacteria bacterium RIFCSPLOWO2_01_FULL_34_15 TaxID=1797579 RepID=A0A1F5EMZ6_9BACT|nr:MAG: hypothetical protein A2996_01705 [Candidatus Campbellbacteria bacterium RIFCSPLOWO2_01_FULL_34_15]